MDEQNTDSLLTSDVFENGTFSERQTIIVKPYSVGHSDESLHHSPRNGDDNPSEGHIFIPHPPETPNDSQNSPRRLKTQNGKHFDRRLQRKLSDESSSGDEKVGRLKDRVALNGSKLPPIKKSGHENAVASMALQNGEDNTGLNSNNGHLVPSLKPLAPLKDQRKLVEDFKLNQATQKEKINENDNILKGPIRPIATNNVSSTKKSNGQAARKGEDLNNNTDNVEDVSQDTLTSVSSESSSSISDSECEQDQTRVNGLSTKFKPAPPSTPSLRSQQHHSLSLTSVRDQHESVGGHSDSEAIFREQKVNRRNTRELWKKAKMVSYLPKVPQSKARARNSNFIKEELERYLPERKLMVFIGTWNMHGEKQLPVFVDDFLLPECCQFMQDLYVIGSQESTPLRKEWEIKLQEALGPSHVMIYSCAFGVLHVAMFIRRELVWFCSAVEQATVATRPGHMIKTKGAIGISLSIFGTSFLFINSHFTAHEPKWKERIADYRLIRRTLSLPLNYSETPNRNTDVTSRFQQVFWFGDFNFRVSEHQGVVEKFLRNCEEDEVANYDELLNKDQMTKLMRKDGAVFEHFKECPINFPPTYRFDINPDDPGHYSSIRVPSWTDRIVYRTKEDDDIKPIHYDHCPSLINSDHRPVYGIFEASLQPIKDRVAFTGIHFVPDVYIEANRRRVCPPRNQNQTSVCTIL